MIAASQTAATNAFGTIFLLRWVVGYALRRWQGMAAMLGALLAKVAFDLLKP